MTNAMAPAVEARGLSKRYGSVLAVDGVDLRIAREEQLGLHSYGAVALTSAAGLADLFAWLRLADQAR